MNKNHPTPPFTTHRSTIQAVLIVACVALVLVIASAILANAAGLRLDFIHDIRGKAALASTSNQSVVEHRSQPSERGQPGLPMLPGEEDGVIVTEVTVFDDDTPAVANLDHDLLDALRQAATDAADDGIEIFVTSGWRSPAYQNHLLEEAIAEYGSEAEAARWVATADTSLHVSGDAVDIGPEAAMVWLSEHGAAYGLCQIYVNEPWHYELRPDASDEGCPPMYADPTEDPRMNGSSPRDAIR